eukprot:COSAG02_NODE_6171_length_3752_cov_14.986860_6_plen_86_part_00
MSSAGSQELAGKRVCRTMPKRARAAASSPDDDERPSSRRSSSTQSSQSNQGKGVRPEPFPSAAAVALLRLSLTRAGPSCAGGPAA